MESVSKIILTKYLPDLEIVKPANLVTDAEYKIVQRANLDDVLNAENNPAVLDRICEGEKLQTSEFYNRQEKKYNMNVAKIYRKPRTASPTPRTVPTGAPRRDPPPAVPRPTRETVPVAALPIAIDDTIEPIRSLEGAIAPTEQPPPLATDPFQLPEHEINTFPPAPLSLADLMISGDDNFGSENVDGAREFLEMCTGEALPPMSLRESRTRDMLVSQFPGSLRRSAPPLVDNFQDIDLGAFKKSNSRRPDAETLPPTDVSPDIAPLEGAPQQEPTVENVPTSEETVPPPTTANPPQPAAIPLVESSSSAEEQPVAVPRPRRTRRDIAFTQVLESFESTARKMPPVRRNFDIFSFPFRPVWNKTIQDVQNRLAEMHEQQQQQRQVQQEQEQMRDAPAPAMATTNQTADERSQNIVPAISVTDNSNLVSINRTDGRIALDDPSAHINNVVEPKKTLDLVGQLEHLESIVQLPALTEDTPATVNDSSGTRQTANKQKQPDTGFRDTNEMTANFASSDVPPAVAESQTNKEKEKDAISTEKRSKTEAAITHENKNDISDALFNQAKELGTIPEKNDSIDVTVTPPLDTMLIDIIIVVQSQICKQRVNRISLKNLPKLLRINSPIGTAKMVKNVLQLKQAGLLEAFSDSNNHVTHVALKFPDDRDEPE